MAPRFAPQSRMPSLLPQKTDVLWYPRKRGIEHLNDDISREERDFNQKLKDIRFTGTHFIPNGMSKPFMDMDEEEGEEEEDEEEEEEDIQQIEDQSLDYGQVFVEDILTIEHQNSDHSLEQQLQQSFEQDHHDQPYLYSPYPSTSRYNGSEVDGDDDENNDGNQEDYSHIENDHHGLYMDRGDGQMEQDIGGWLHGHGQEEFEEHDLDADIEEASIYGDDDDGEYSEKQNNSNSHVMESETYRTPSPPE
ncbi:hypothetical protein FBU30_004822 [Linnemannia zychae]|nr:hypothetical protein FBU30_004822 [Linnemannia zychae]